MKKTVILVIVGFLMNTVLFAEEPLAYKVTETSEAYKEESIKTLQKEDIVYSNKMVKYDYINAEDIVFLMDLAEPNDEYVIHVKNLSPLNTENVFGDEIIIDYPPDRYSGGYHLPHGDVKEMWVPAYYCYVLKSENRETLLKFNLTLEMLTDNRGGGHINWYEEINSDITNGRSMFYNAAIKIGYDTHFLVKNIKKNGIRICGRLC